MCGAGQAKAIWSKRRYLKKEIVQDRYIIEPVVNKAGVL